MIGRASSFSSSACPFSFLKDFRCPIGKWNHWGDVFQKGLLRQPSILGFGVEALVLELRLCNRESCGTKHSAQQQPAQQVNSRQHLAQAMQPTASPPPPGPRSGWRGASCRHERLADLVGLERGAKSQEDKKQHVFVFWVCVCVCLFLSLFLKDLEAPKRFSLSFFFFEEIHISWFDLCGYLVRIFGLQMFESGWSFHWTHKKRIFFCRGSQQPSEYPKKGRSCLNIPVVVAYKVVNNYAKDKQQHLLLRLIIPGEIPSWQTRGKGKKNSISWLGLLCKVGQTAECHKGISTRASLRICIMLLYASYGDVSIEPGHPKWILISLGFP